MCYRILHILSCCSCCGLCNLPEKYAKKGNPLEKMNTLRTLEEISKSDAQKSMSFGSDPTASDLTDLTDIVEIPSDKFKNKDQVIEHYGFKVNQFIDQGSFAMVYRGTHIKRELTIACKEIFLDRDKFSKKKPVLRIKDVKNELYVLQRIRHPHIIRMIKHFVIMENNVSTLYVFMQLAVGGSLSSLLKQKGPFDEDTCMLWFAQMLNALVFMHERKVAHRDLKLANILLDASHDVLISDFGLSRIAFRKSKGGVIVSHTYCGTPPFMSPELLSKKPYDPFAADVWALGIILYSLFNKDYPFPLYKQKWRTINLMNKKKWDFSTQISDHPSDGLRDILTKIFEPKPQKRPTMEKLTVHHWIKTVYKNVDKKTKEIINQFQSLRLDEF